MSTGIDREVSELQAVIHALESRGWVAGSAQQDVARNQREVTIGRGDLVLVAYSNNVIPTVAVLRSLLEVVSKFEVQPGVRYAGTTPLSMKDYAPSSDPSMHIIDIHCRKGNSYLSEDKVGYYDNYGGYNNYYDTTTTYYGNSSASLIYSAPATSNPTNTKKALKPNQESSLDWLDRRVSEIQELVRVAA